MYWQKIGGIRFGTPDPTQHCRLYRFAVCSQWRNVYYTVHPYTVLHHHQIPSFSSSNISRFPFASDRFWIRSHPDPDKQAMKLSAVSAHIMSFVFSRIVTRQVAVIGWQSVSINCRICYQLVCCWKSAWFHRSIIKVP